MRKLFLLLMIGLMAIAPAYAVTTSPLSLFGSAVVAPIFSAFADPDWVAWDGTDDGPDNHFFSAENGMHGPTAVEFSSRSEFLAIIRDREGINRRLVNVYSLADDDTITEESSLALSVAAGGVFPDIIKLTDSKWLGVFSGNAIMRIYLLTKTGTTIVETAVSSAIVGENQSSLMRLTDTTAVLFYDEDASTFKSVIIDITGDSIAIGTKKDTGIAGSKYGAMTVISPTEFVAAVGTSAGDKLFWYSVSGSTITEIDNIRIDTVAAFVSDMGGMAKVDSDTVLLAYEEDGASDNIFANTFTLTGSTISKGTRATIVSGTRLFTGPQGKRLIPLDDGNFMYTGVHQDVSTSQSRQTSISVDGSNSITINNTVAVDGDHGTLALVPDTNNTKVLIATQDGTTTPSDQVRFQILNGI